MSRAGSVDFLCWPRFDSAACFAALLGTPAHGFWRIAPADPQPRVRRAYRDGTLVLETAFFTPAGEVALIDFMPVGEAGSHLVRLVQGRSGRVKMRLNLTPRFGYGATRPRITPLPEEPGIAAVAGPEMVVLRTPLPLRIEADSAVAGFSVAAGETVAFVLSHGAGPRPPPGIDAAAALARTERDWRDWSARSHCPGPDPAAVQRSLISLKALVFSPTGGIVAAPTTSSPEEPGGSRNWDYRYCWLRDSALTIQALLRAGQVEEARAWRDWLHRCLAGPPAQMQIMYGLSGERLLTEREAGWLPGYQGARPVRLGNAAHGQLQLDVYGEVADALHEARAGGADPEV